MDDVLESEVVLDGRSLKFHLPNPADGIQRYLAAGKFYDLAQLRYHQQLIAKRRVVLDVGTNIGNHALFYATHTAASKVVVFEPNPVARDILLKNIELNSASNIDLSRVNYGVGAKRSIMSVGAVPGHNLGGASLVAAGKGDGAQVEVAPLDELVIDEQISFIKIDVEGMEMRVLEGAGEVIKKWRPAIAIEIANNHIAPFWQWADKSGYHVVNAFRMYAANINYVCIPKF
jgi:FkbM family methyltransferase